MPLASVRDIASMKAYTLGRRRSFKDYVDLYVILKNDIAPISEIITDAEKKYGEAFNDRLFLEQLLSPEDIEDEPIAWLIDEVSKKEMVVFLEKIVEKHLGS